MFFTGVGLAEAKSTYREKSAMQVLKEEVKNRILTAAVHVFYKNDFRSASLAQIAHKAKVPVALIYTYFKNKEELFDAVVEGVYSLFIHVLDEEEQIAGSPSEKFEKVGEQYIKDLLENHVKLVILTDKSGGTKHEKAKEKLIMRLQKHIEIGLKSYSCKTYDPMLSHILANNYMESLLEIARHYKNSMWAENMIRLINLCYYKGAEAL